MSCESATRWVSRSRRRTSTDLRIGGRRSTARIPRCSPARAATLTSQGPFTSGVHSNASAAISEVVEVSDTIFGAAHGSGSYTAMRGKLLHGVGPATQTFLDPVLDDIEWEGGWQDTGTDDLNSLDFSPLDVPDEDHFDAMIAAWGGRVFVHLRQR